MTARWAPPEGVTQAEADMAALLAALPMPTARVLYSTVATLAHRTGLPTARASMLLRRMADAGLIGRKPYGNRYHYHRLGDPL